ncbi:MAG: methyltransferase domain-containing protein [Pseudonocardiaceae bacterium]
MDFTEAERSYLAGQMLGRLVTVGPGGTLRVRPLGSRLNPDDAIAPGGPRLTATQRNHNVLESRNVHLAEAQEPVADAPATQQTTPSRAVFDEAYTSRTAPWVIGEPQPVIVALERGGWIRGSVLDAGCGTGEHTIYLTRLGYDVRGIDSSEHAIDQARANAAERNVAARFEVADALQLGHDQIYDTVVDSALFHIFDPGDRGRYVRSLHRACRPGALVHVLALSDTGPGFGPQVSDTMIREAFGEGWAVEDLRSSEYRGVIANSTHATALGLPVGDLVDLPAWLARARRI